MNKKQKKILWIGIIIIALMGMFPPYNYEVGFGFGGKKHVSYDFFLSPPYHSSAELDFARLTIQWIIVSVLTAGAIYSTKESKDKTNVRPEKQQNEENKTNAKEDEGFSKIAEQVAERHNKYGVTLTDPRTGKDLLAGMTDEQREKYRQFKIKTSNKKQKG